MTLSKKSSGNPEIGEPKGWKLCGPVGGISTTLVVDQWMVISSYPGVVSKSKRSRVLWKTTSCECESTYIIP